ncbi:MAG: hypothetical protein CFH01_01972 [Alphaproteobacteria bacterium MarineAlpha2_Bin1]|nr:MAG: hypothetical protein CFH01_01972 [Alphaproteobacteria bacterium MarineAlpha2_Bin1]
MFYKTEENNHGLSHDPFKAIVAPRPIGWIGSIDTNGVPNLAPYSYFNAISDNPYFVVFGSINYKDSIKNCEDNKDFTCSLVSENLFNAMNNSSATVNPEVDEFNLSGIKKESGKIVKAPFVKGCCAALECQHWKTIDLPGSDRSTGQGNFIIIAKVVGIYIDDKYIINGRFDIASVKPLARLGYMDYGVIGKNNIFSKNRPKVNKQGDLKAVDDWDGIYR